MDDAPSGGPGARSPRGRTRGPSVLTPPRGLPVFPDLQTAHAERADIIRCCRRLPAVAVDPCLCGHGKAAHEHYRPGWDCGICGSLTCVDYRPADCGPVRRLLRRWGRSGR